MLHIIYQTLIRLLQSIFLMQPPRTVLNIDHYCTDPHRTDIATIAYNNPIVIQKQIELVKKYIYPPYNHLVADNSSNSQTANQIKNICATQNVIYIKLPPNHLSLIGASYSHAAAINYTYRKIIAPRAPQYFGFIDHDLFPITPICIPEKLNKTQLYGRIIHRQKYWYLWSGLCFYDTTAMQSLSLDFLPVTINGTYLDSGGTNWKTIYAHMPPPRDLIERQYRIHDNGTDYHADYIHLIDNSWLHLINGSNWANQKPHTLNTLAKQLKGEKYPITWGNKKSKNDEIDQIIAKFESESRNL